MRTTVVVARVPPVVSSISCPGIPVGRRCVFRSLSHFGLGLFYHSVVLSLTLATHPQQTPWSERKALMRVLWTVIISPFGKVRFLEGYVGDILTR